MRLRVMTFNVQHFHPFKSSENWEEIDLRPFADAVRCFAPDVVGFNEVRGEGASPEFFPQAKALAEALGWNWFFAPAVEFPGRGLYGNAILSKLPLLEPENIPIPLPGVKKGYIEPRCVAKATISVGDGITLLATHFGLSSAEEENGAETLCTEIRKSTKPVIAMGDFNATPDDPVLAPVFDLLRDTADLLTRPLPSFPSDFPTKKIDYVLCSRELHPTFAAIPPLVLSDHRPFLADFEV